MNKHTEGEWFTRRWMGSAEHNAMLKEHGMTPTPALTNDGARIVMCQRPDGESVRIGVVDAQAVFKRGKGHFTNCPERDANARLFASASKMRDLLFRIMCANMKNPLPSDTDKEIIALLTYLDSDESVP